jgi:hypothetical protein
VITLRSSNWIFLAMSYYTPQFLMQFVGIPHSLLLLPPFFLSSPLPLPLFTSLMMIRCSQLNCLDVCKTWVTNEILENILNSCTSLTSLKVNGCPYLYAPGTAFFLSFFRCITFFLVVFLSLYYFLSSSIFLSRCSTFFLVVFSRCKIINPQFLLIW